MDAYIYKNVFEKVIKSSSGGAFARIVETLINSYGNVEVYGAVWENNKVIHKKYSLTKYSGEFSGSKYARSEMGDMFKSVLKDLKENKYVLFSGTPCQVAGLKKLVELSSVNDEKLYIVDVICHGTPSPKIFSDWISLLEKKYGSTVKKITLRDKKVRWTGYPTTILFKNGKKITRTYDSQMYIRLFFSLQVLGRSCYECKFSNLKRNSDITLGDFWGIWELAPEVDCNGGVSLLLCNTKKGEDIISLISNSLDQKELLLNANDLDYLKYQQNLRESTSMPKNHEEFWCDYRENGFAYVLKKYRLNNIDSRIKYTIKYYLNKFGLYKRDF